jgi:putative oxidoreductase
MKFFESFYRSLITVGRYFQSILLLAMRLYWGGSLVISGLGKLQNASAVAEFFASLNIPYPLVNAYLVGSIELIGGLCLFIGFASRLASLPLISVLTVALLTEHKEALFNALNDPLTFIHQLPFNYLLTAFIVFAFGPGKLSVDYLIQKFFYPADKKNEVNLRN